MAALRIRKATTADLDTIEHSVNAVCRKGIYLVPFCFTMPDWHESMCLSTLLRETPQLPNLSDSLDEINVKLGLKMSAEAGAYVAPTGAEADYKVTLEWKQE